MIDNRIYHVGIQQREKEGKEWKREREKKTMIKECKQGGVEEKNVSGVRIKKSESNY